MTSLQPQGLLGVRRSCERIPLWDVRVPVAFPCHRPPLIRVGLCVSVCMCLFVSGMWLYALAVFVFFQYMADTRNFYIATEFAGGGSLRSWATRLCQGWALSVPSLAQAASAWYNTVVPRLAWQMTQAVAYLATHQVCHLDLDPQNIGAWKEVVWPHDMVHVVLWSLTRCRASLAVLRSCDDVSAMLIDFGSSRSCFGAASLVGDAGIKFKPHFSSPLVCLLHVSARM